MGARKRNRSCIYATDSEGISLSRWIFLRILLKNVTETWQTEESTERMEKKRNGLWTRLEGPPILTESEWTNWSAPPKKDGQL
jgi:hypothetical protein